MTTHYILEGLPDNLEPSNTITGKTYTVEITKVETKNDVVYIHMKFLSNPQE